LKNQLGEVNAAERRDQSGNDDEDAEHPQHLGCTRRGCGTNEDNADHDPNHRRQIDHRGDLEKTGRFEEYPGSGDSQTRDGDDE